MRMPRPRRPPIGYNRSKRTSTVTRNLLKIQTLDAAARVSAAQAAALALAGGHGAAQALVLAGLGARCAARPPKAAGLLLRGEGKAGEADPRRGKPSKPGLGPLDSLLRGSVEAYICQ